MSVCSVCGSSSFVRDDLGYDTCVVCGVQRAVVEEKLEFDPAIATSRRKQSRTNTRASHSNNDTLDALQLSLHDSRLLLECFHFLLRAQSITLVANHRCHSQVIGAVGRLFVSLIGEWRSHGWGGDDQTILVYPSAPGIKRRALRREWQKNRAEAAVAGDETKEAVDNGGSEAMEDDADHAVRDESDAPAIPPSTNDDTAQSSQQSRDGPATKLRPSVILEVGELSLPLSLALLYLACTLAREPITCQHLCNLAKTGQLPYWAFMDSGRVPSRLSELVSKSPHVNMFFRPSVLPSHSTILRVASFLARRLGLPMNVSAGRRYTELPRVNRSSATLCSLKGAPVNTHALLQLLMLELSVPTAIEPMALELLSLNARIQGTRSFAVIDEFSVAAALVLAVKLVFGLDRQPSDNHRDESLSSRIQRSCLSLITADSIDWLTIAQIRAHIQDQFELSDTEARQHVNDLRSNIDARTSAVKAERARVEAPSADGGRGNGSEHPTWNVHEKRQLSDRLLELLRSGHSLRQSFAILTADYPHKLPSIKHLYYYELRPRIEARMELESLTMDDSEMVIVKESKQREKAQFATDCRRYTLAVKNSQLSATTSAGGSNSDESVDGRALPSLLQLRALHSDPVQSSPSLLTSSDRQFLARYLRATVFGPALPTDDVSEFLDKAVDKWRGDRENSNDSEFSSKNDQRSPLSAWFAGLQSSLMDLSYNRCLDFYNTTEHGSDRKGDSNKRWFSHDYLLLLCAVSLVLDVPVSDMDHRCRKFLHEVRALHELPVQSAALGKREALIGAY